MFRALYVALILRVTFAQQATIVSLPLQYTYLLSSGFEGIIPTAIGSGEIITTFPNSTQTFNDTIAAALAAANEAAFISYSEEFLNLLGPSPNVTLVEDRPGEFFAFEGTIWLPDRNQAWLTSALYQPPGILSVLNLQDNIITQPNISAPYKNFQRGIYSSTDGQVYMTTYRDNQTYSGGFVAINPDTFEVQTLFNSYFGLRFNALNDPTWYTTSNDSDARYIFISDIQNFLEYAYDPIAPNQLFTTMYRYNLLTNELQPVLSGSQQPTITGNKLGPDLRTLYIADGGDPSAQVAASQVIYKYDIDHDGIPVNKRVFAVPRIFLDGIQVDDRGRVWTAEGDGIVVRDSNGSILGVFNQLYFGRAGNPPMGNFILCGDVLVILALDRVWTVQLAESVVTPESRHIFN